MEMRLRWAKNVGSKSNPHHELDKPKVAGIIVGVRLGLSDHRKDNARVSSSQLDGQDLERIETILTRSNDLYRLIGDGGDEYSLS
jgi:hypothetical protein